MPKAKLINLKVVERQILGLAESGQKQNEVTIDPRQGDKEMLYTCIHEGLHIAFPELSEDEIIRAERIIGQVPWKMGYRRKKIKKKS